MSKPPGQEHFEFNLPENQRLDIFLSAKFEAKASRSQIQKLISKGLVLIGGKPVNKPSYRAKLPEVGMITFEIEQPYTLAAKENTEVDVIILHQDEDVAVIHKPPGITVHPGAGTADDTLLHHLLHEIKNLSDGSEHGRPGIVHRLDRGTEGLLLVAKNNKSHELLARQFKERTIYKEYHAWVAGGGEDKDQLISGFIGRHPQKRKLMLFSKESFHPTCKQAELIFSTEKNHRVFSLVKIQLLTGRTHQIRASFSYLKRPVVGDLDYGFQVVPSWNNKTRSIINHSGILLVANRIRFKHPGSGKEIELSIDLPERFSEFEKSLGDT